MDSSETELLSGLIDGWLAAEDLRGKSVLVVTPDATRSCPLASIVHLLQTKLHGYADRLDYLVALGTHKRLDRAELGRLYGVDPEAAGSLFAGSRFLNHEWDRVETLATIGKIPAATVRRLSDGYLSEDIDVEINRLVFEYERILVISPVFPHEVVGFSGGVKYFFPGISGGEFVQQFHWLGGMIGASNIIGRKETCTRALIDYAAGLLDLDVAYLTLVVHEDEAIEAAFLGAYDEAWPAAVEVARRVHVVHHPEQMHTVIGIAPRMFSEIWTAGKVMYKLERMVAPGGRLIIYAPHIATISYTWGTWIERVGYHTRDYLLAHPDLLEGVPRGMFAQSCYVKGLGRYVDGVEFPRIDVVLATAIPEGVCTAVNLSYLDHRTLNVDEYRNREDEGYLVVDNAGEALHIPDEEIPW